MSPPTAAKSRKEAEKAAAAALFVLMGVDGAIGQPSPPTEVRHPEPAIAPPSATAVDPAVRTHLETLCSRRGWGTPSFEVCGGGPPHKPVFDAVVTVQIGGRQMRSSPCRAGSKKEAKRAAAAAILDELQSLSQQS